MRSAMLLRVTALLAITLHLASAEVDCTDPAMMIKSECTGGCYSNGQLQEGKRVDECDVCGGDGSTCGTAAQGPAAAPSAGSGYGSGYGPPSVPPSVPPSASGISGCMDSEASNYNSAATLDDDSCVALEEEEAIAEALEEEEEALEEEEEIAEALAPVNDKKCKGKFIEKFNGEIGTDWCNKRHCKGHLTAIQCEGKCRDNTNCTHYVTWATDDNFNHEEYNKRQCLLYDGCDEQVSVTGSHDKYKEYHTRLYRMRGPDELLLASTSSSSKPSPAASDSGMHINMGPLVLGAVCGVLLTVAVFTLNARRVRRSAVVDYTEVEADEEEQALV